MTSSKMKKPFLEHVARDVIGKFGTDLSRIAIVFPNKRAALFLNDYLARQADRPIWSPIYLTISDLFCQHSQLTLADPIKLVADLHRVFTEVTGSNETLDQFYGWGTVLLSDFDDIDKNLADPSKVLANLRDIHELDDASYLSDEQRKILQQFFGNFNSDHNSIIKKRFLTLWSRLYDIYIAYNSRLVEQDLAYEGALFRRVVTDETVTFNHDVYLFVGFNMLHQVEQQLFRKIRQQKKVYFYWDFDKFYMDGIHESGHFIRRHLADFPNELDNASPEIYDNLSRKKDITFISASTNTVQARYISQWLSEENKNRIRDGHRTAVILCDERLLQTAVHSIPEEAGTVNVTIGYPLSQSPFASLVEMLVAMQTEGYSKKKGTYLSRHVLRVLNHPYSQYITDNSQELCDAIRKNMSYHPSRNDLMTSPETTLMFRDVYVGTAPPAASIAQWLADILRHIGTRADLPSLAQESLFRMYTLVNRLRMLIEQGDLAAEVNIFRRLLRQLIQTTTIPFHGEPVEGMQIMGLLETRNLDFEHVLILSCNEGIMPKGTDDSSFIPYTIRKAYGLTTIDHQVSIYSYYFYSLLQRASDITILYNNSTEDGNRGEMSRFMMQLMVDHPHQIRMLTLQTRHTTDATLPAPIGKTPSVTERLKNLNSISPSDINRFLRCPLQFYYTVIAELKEPMPYEENIDNRLFGNIFHKAAQLAYSRIMTDTSPDVRKETLDRYIHNPRFVPGIVDEAFREEFFKTASPTYNGLHMINRQVIIDYLEQLLNIDAQLAPFTILGLEMPVKTATPIFRTQNSSVKIHGIIDRLDLITEQDGKQYIRVIDYKTGNRTQQSVSSVSDIFNTQYLTTKHTDYYLQTMLYAYIARHDRKYNPDDLPIRPALIFIQHTKAENYDPVLLIDRQPVHDINLLSGEFEKGLHSLLQDIFDPDRPFMPTTDRKRCNTCPFKKICFT